MEYVDKTALFGEFDVGPGRGVTGQPAGKPADPEQVDVHTEDLDLTLKLRIIQIASVSNGFFKHQQIGDPDLTKEEKRRIVSELLETRPSVFLARFGSFLSEDHLVYFEDVKDNYEVDFYLHEARQRQCKFVQGQKIKNRRFQAMQNMIKEGDEHFSEESMRQRNPLLYQQLIRQFQTQEEKTEADRPDMTNCSLSNIIIEHLDLNRERDLAKRLQGDEDDEEFDSDSETDTEPMAVQVNLREEDKEAYRREFVQAAYRSFLEGKDSGIDYSRIDENSALDDLGLEDRELEEKYFDDDELED